MNKIILKNLTLIILAIVLPLIIAFIYFIVLCQPDCPEDNELRTWVLGISLILLIVGLITLLIIYLIFYIKEYWIRCKEEDGKKNSEQEKELNQITIERIRKDSDRLIINDYFRLVELSKEITKKTESAQVGEKKDTLLVRELDFKEEVNIAKLEQLLQHYNDQITKYIKREKDV